MLNKYDTYSIKIASYKEDEKSLKLVNPWFYINLLGEIPSIGCNTIYLAERKDESYEVKINWKDILFGNIEIPKINEDKLMLLIDNLDCGIEFTGDSYMIFLCLQNFLKNTKTLFVGIKYY